MSIVEPIQVKPTRVVAWRDSLIVNAPADDPILSSLPCWRYVRGRNFFMFPATLFMLRRLEKKCGSIVLSGDAGVANDLREWSKRYDEGKRLRDLPSDELPNPPIEKVPSWKHQKNGFWFAFNTPAGILSEGLGTGKSKQIIELIENRNHKITVIVTKAGLVEDWPAHIAAHAATPLRLLALDAIVGKRGGIVKETSTKKAARITEALKDKSPIVIVISYDNVWRKAIAAVLAEAGVDFLVLDEGHNIGDPESVRGKFLCNFARRVPFRLVASGTIAKHKPEDLFTVFKFLDPAIVGVRFDVFKDRYCLFNRPSNRELDLEVMRAHDQLEAARATGDSAAILPLMNAHELAKGTRAKLILVPRFVVGYQRLAELHQIFRAVSFHCESDVLDLPEPIHLPRKFDLGPEESRVYGELEDEFVSTLNDEYQVDAKMPLVRMLRLQQVTSGFAGEVVYDPETGEIMDTIAHPIGDAKLQLLAEVLSEISIDEPIVVACRFKHDLVAVRRVCEMAGRACFEQSGARKEKMKWIGATGGESLIGQMASICEGSDLTRARYMILFSIGFSLFQYEQVLGRINRPGQKAQPCFIHLVARNTIDVKNYSALRRRREVIDDIIYGPDSRPAA